MPVGPLVQLSSLVAMAPLLRGLGLMGTGRGVPEEGLQWPHSRTVSHQGLLTQKKYGAVGAVKGTRQTAEGIRHTQEQKERQGETEVDGGKWPSDRKTVGN